MNSGVIIVHCPSCGAAVAVTPQVQQVTLGHGRILVSFENHSTKHECD